MARKHALELFMRSIIEDDRSTPPMWFDDSIEKYAALMQADGYYALRENSEIFDALKLEKNGGVVINDETQAILAFYLAKLREVLTELEKLNQPASQTDTARESGQNHDMITWLFDQVAPRETSEKNPLSVSRADRNSAISQLRACGYQLMAGMILFNVSIKRGIEGTQSNAELLIKGATTNTTCGGLTTQLCQFNGRILGDLKRQSKLNFFQPGNMAGMGLSFGAALAFTVFTATSAIPTFGLSLIIAALAATAYFAYKYCNYQAVVTSTVHDEPDIDIIASCSM